MCQPLLDQLPSKFLTTFFVNTDKNLKVRQVKNRKKIKERKEEK
jgi:hypothetical protein